jgi:heme exporter protein D
MSLIGLDLGPHYASILVSYGLALLVVAALVSWVVIDHRQQQRLLNELEARGVRRRSSRTTAS